MERRDPGKIRREGGVRVGGKERRGCGAVSEPRVGGCPEPALGVDAAPYPLAPPRGRNAVLQAGVRRMVWSLRRAVGAWRMRGAAEQHGGGLVSGRRGSREASGEAGAPLRRVRGCVVASRGWWDGKLGAGRCGRLQEASRVRAAPGPEAGGDGREGGKEAGIPPKPAALHRPLSPRAAGPSCSTFLLNTRRA